MVHDKLGIEIDDSHEHHTTFSYRDILVENHYDFINTKSQKSNAALDARMKELLDKGGVIGDKEIENLYYPNAQFNALFLIRHCAAHFASTEMTLRQLLDWLLFAASPQSSPKEGGCIDWKMLYQDLRRFNLDKFADAMNAFGVKYLGFGRSLFPSVSEDDTLVERILNDILSPEFTEREDGTLLSGLWVKSRRWWHNRWKHAITSPDSLWSSFWWGVHAKLLKPAHFRQ